MSRSQGHLLHHHHGGGYRQYSANSNSNSIETQYYKATEENSVSHENITSGMDIQNSLTEEEENRNLR